MTEAGRGSDRRPRRVAQAWAEMINRAAGAPQWLRFVAVGVFTTAIYLVVSVGLSSWPLHVPQWAASLAGFAVSFMVSYLGHLNFTYRAEPDHLRYGLRFALGTSALIAGFSALSQYLNTHFHIGHLWSNVFVAIFFPPSSFLLHTFWSFATRHRGQSYRKAR